MEKQVLEIIKKASDGSQKAFEKLIDLKSETILFHSLSILGKYQDAEDVAQEVILKIHKNIKKLKKPEAFNAWMQRIISNECYNLGRKQKVRNEVLDFDEHEGELIEEEKDFIPYEYVANEESKSLLKKCIDELPEKQRRVIIMYYFDDMSYSEIAYAMDVTVSTVSTNILYAKKAIKRKLETHMIKDGKDASKLATVPVLTQVLNEQVKEKISSDQLNHFKKMSVEAINRTSSPFKSNALRLGKIIIATILGTGVVTISMLGITGNIPSKKIEIKENNPVAVVVDKDVKGSINFGGGECECGHLNPKSASASLDVDFTKSHLNIKNLGNEVLCTGNEEEIAEYMGQLIKNKKNSDYLLEYVFETEEYGTIYIKREFVVDTNGASENRYR